MRARFFSALVLLACAAFAHAAAGDVPAPVAIAEGVYVMLGDGDAVAPANRGIVANNGFIVGKSGVTVVDTGSSYRYGRAMIEAIRKLTPLPVELVIITHQAPEFVFGASAFRDKGVPILAQRRAAELIRERCAICLKNLQRTLGDEEMSGSRVTVPDRTVEGTTQIESGGRNLQLLHFGPASTPGDLAVLDTATGVVFAGGLVSNGRIPELRNEQIPGWLGALDKLRAMDPRVVVPGFGPLLKGDGIMQTGAYLRELDAGVRRAYASGTGLTDAMRTVQVPAFSHYKLYAIAQPQNVQRLYLQLEKQ
ncbi:beta-lactamase domain-containing protein [Caballeronia terrestris]|jgi:glyoxylase-like metal-dependent hydrolase (beta-lactamase superfamily II)|uniref:Beta-lactamase domain-containing protein n=1 Tax=Caballeronia terrestris TaxID=1226301 RepID=A0A158F2G5_9BURK|nr:MBL fold metallo-hydrolase [Caballeronia terrestris]SAL14024.1 beta-lactamase domain-containing protein [Caballeronia terrestris]